MIRNPFEQNKFKGLYGPPTTMDRPTTVLDRGGEPEEEMDAPRFMTPPSRPHSAFDRYKQHISNMPTQQPIGWKDRLKAGIMGSLTSLADNGRNPLAGYETATNMLEMPYKRSLEQWKMQGAMLEEGARLEGTEFEQNRQVVKDYNDVVKTSIDDRRADIESGARIANYADLARNREETNKRLTSRDREIDADRDAARRVTQENNEWNRRFRAGQQRSTESYRDKTLSLRGRALNNAEANTGLRKAELTNKQQKGTKPSLSAELRAENRAVQLITRTNPEYNEFFVVPKLTGRPELDLEAISKKLGNPKKVGTRGNMLVNMWENYKARALDKEPTIVGLDEWDEDLYDNDDDDEEDEDDY